MTQKIQKTDEQWRAELTPEQYEVLRRKGTERPWSGVLNDCKEPGVYRCAGCGSELFRSDEKFDSGSGWPSFFAPAADGAVDDRGGPQLLHEAHRGPVLDLRWAPGPRLRRRPEPHRAALLHQLGGAHARALGGLRVTVGWRRWQDGSSSSAPPATPAV